MKTKFVEYLSEEYFRLTQVVYQDWHGYKLPHGWITWELIEIENKKIAKMVWTRY